MISEAFVFFMVFPHPHFQNALKRPPINVLAVGPNQSFSNVIGPIRPGTL